MGATTCSERPALIVSCSMGQLISMTEWEMAEPTASSSMAEDLLSVEE